MFDTRAGRPAAAVVREWVDGLRTAGGPATDVEQVDLIGALEELKSAAAAAQARAAAELDASVRAQHAARGLPPERQGRGVAAQVALARRESPSRGGRHLGLAKALAREMPHTLAALTDGRLSEWRATLLVRETACLSREDRARVDEELWAEPARIEGLGDGSLAGEARRVAYRLDPHSVVRRARKAETERRVSLRPAPDTMSYLTSLLPVTQGVAAWAALNVAADQARAAGDQRSRGQVMADTLVERLTGQATAAATPVEVRVVMTDRALLQGSDEPAVIPGYGPVPASWARDLLRPSIRPDDAAGDSPAEVVSAAEVWLRRLFTHPDTGELVAMESRARAFPPALRDLLITRDQVCRTPWCDAPVRHADHAVRHADGGATDTDNGQGLCEACNYVKDAPDWTAGPAPGSALGRHEIETVTPTGHRYTSRPPPQPGHRPGQLARDPLSHRALVAGPVTTPELGPLERALADHFARHGEAA